MRTSLADLNAYLFEELDRLSNDDLTGEQLDAEVKRAKALTSVAGKIAGNAQLVLTAEKIRGEYGNNAPGVAALLGVSND